jgi:hypothetical protein
MPIIYKNINYLDLSTNLNFTGSIRQYSGGWFQTKYYQTKYFRSVSGQNNFEELTYSIPDNIFNPRTHEPMAEKVCIQDNPNSPPGLYACRYPIEEGNFDYKAIEYLCDRDEQEIPSDGVRITYDNCVEQRQTCPITWPLTNSGIATITNGSCQNGAVTITAQVNGGNTPYQRYEWFYKKHSDPDSAWEDNKVTVLCGGIPSCNNSHTFSGLLSDNYDFKLQVVESSGSYFVSNELDGISCQANNNKCGIDINGNMFCSSLGTGSSCLNAGECGVCKKR